jgi:hypothetical protein
MFPQLTAAITDIVAFMDDDEGPNFDAAQQRAVDAYRNELLPTVLGGEWSRGQLGMPWSDPYSLELYDHPIWFRRRDIHGPRSWQTCAVLGSPYQSEIIDENAEFTLDFLVAAQPLLKRRIGIWMSSDLSWWFPGQTICVLVAAGLESERARGFGFRAVGANDWTRNVDRHLRSACRRAKCTSVERLLSMPLNELPVEF